MLVVRKLIVDDWNEIFDAQGMKYVEYPSDFARIREYSGALLADCPELFKEGSFLEMQISEIIKNAVKHGNRNDPAKLVKIHYDFRKRVRLIVEDEGAGFQNLDEWNDFLARRQTALYNQDFDSFMKLASYRGPHSDDTDGGNSLISALEYWNGGMIYGGRRNKVGVIRWFSGGSAV